MVFLGSFLFFALILLAQSSDSGEYINNACNNLEDGDYLLKLIDGDDYPLVNVKCSNGYAIVDYSKDNDWTNYFVSFRQFHYALAGPDKNDRVNWQDWYLPSKLSENKLDYKFLVSHDCSQCTEEHTLNQDYGALSAYYMTGNMAACANAPNGRAACDMKFTTYECQYCNEDIASDVGTYVSYVVYNGFNADAENLYDPDALAQLYEVNKIRIGFCGFNVIPANHTSDDDFDLCVRTQDILHYHPSIGMSGSFCVCAKPSDQDVTTYLVSSDIITNKNNAILSGENTAASAEISSYKEERVDNIFTNTDPTDLDAFEASSFAEDLETKVQDNIVYLYQSDFVDGTYRILTSGKYIVMEDITFDFKAPENYLDGNLESYNTEDAWWPTSDDVSKYPGAGQLYGQYFQGFFAGITIEIDNVILDLNGKTLQQSEAYYYQQAFFSLIDLASQPFVPGQGPGFWGATPQFSKNVIIRNGILGLTSHHGIHGNFNQYVIIEHLQILNFKTHAIQMNGFVNLIIRNIDMGPNQYIDKLTPWYSHMRSLLPAFRKISTDNEGACVYFNKYGSCLPFEGMINDLVTVMDMAFKTVLFNANYDNDNNVLWDTNKNVFLNVENNDYTRTSVLYGMFLNYPGANVISWFGNNDKSYNALLENLTIHDLVHTTWENVATTDPRIEHGQIMQSLIGGPFNVFHLFGQEQIDTFDSALKTGTEDDFNNLKLEYIGNIMTDIQIGAYKLHTSWNDIMGLPGTMDILVDFATNPESEYLDTWKIYPYDSDSFFCNMDPMIHPGKGVMGIRINGVENIKLRNVNINNIYSGTLEGSFLCSDDNSKRIGVLNPFSQLPYQTGYSMNMVQGISAALSSVIIEDTVNINNLESKTGLVYGFGKFYGSAVTFNNKNSENNNNILLNINDLYAGTGVKYGTYTYDDFPNRAPEVCGFRVYLEDDNENFDNTNVYQNSDTMIQLQNIYGHVGCMGDDDYTNYGTIQSNSYGEYHEVADLPNTKSGADNPNHKFAGDDNKNKKMDSNNQNQIENISNYKNNNEIIFMAILLISVVVVITLLYVYKKFCSDKLSLSKYLLLSPKPEKNNHTYYGSTHGNMI